MTYQFDSKNYILKFSNGHILYGYQLDSAKCSICGKSVFIDLSYDSLFCANCNLWLEEPADSEYFCSNRPDKPFDREKGKLMKNQVTEAFNRGIHIEVE